MKTHTLNNVCLLLLVMVAAAGGGCSSMGPQRDTTHDAINQELDNAVNNRVKPATPEAVSQALLPPLVVEMPKAEGRPAETRFDLNVNNAPAIQVFMAIVSGTRYSMIVHPDVKDPISVNLKDVTVFEALDTIRDLYGYEYRVQGTRITVLPVKMQTRVYQVNYLQAIRRGRTDVRVSSGSITDSQSSGTGASGVMPAPVGGQIASGANAIHPTESARVTTTFDSDFWGDITKSLDAIVGKADGRNVIVNPQSGVIVVRALPAELRNVASFLRAMRLVVERQVMLEAKLIQVTLSNSFQAGINWAAFPRRDNQAAIGVVNPGATVGNTGTLVAPPMSATLNSAGASLTNAGASLLTGAVTGGVFGLALQTSSFAALLSFLETQGTINVLSSPRVATINNQKAVLKVGTDEFFVTNVSTTAVTSGSGVTTTPTINTQPFFSGIALDVTPQIDENDSILLHIHPAVSSVTEKRKVVDLGSAGVYILPLASSDVNETDTIVRAQDQNIVAIGGLMKQQTSIDRNQAPGIGDVPGIGDLFRQRSDITQKSELVILLRATIIHDDSNWEKEINETRERIRTMQR
jgi:MSHA biogenesis protein MshL